MNFSYKFPAVRGVQSNTEYYISMVPMSLLSKLFMDDTDGDVLPEYRAQRKLNESRIPEIANYILDNRDTYVFSALSASIDGKFKFIGLESSEDVGILEVDMNARFLINDGQHRKAAIVRALEMDDSLANETISIVFFKDEGLARSQQMFTDLNKHAVKTSNSISTLYDMRDSVAMATKNIIEKIPFLRIYTDKERDNLGKNSSHLFTLHNLYKANKKIIKTECSEEDEEFLFKYWSFVSNNINEWSDLMNREITKRSLREDFIITLAITLVSLGKLGSFFYDNPDYNMEEYLPLLRKIDWSRSNSEWKNRVIRPNGKVQNNEEAINLTYIKIKQMIGLPLSKDELIKEKKLGSKNGK